MRELIQRRWAELSPLLDAALDIDSADREAWLAAHCDDTELRAALRGLLVDADRASVIDTGGDRFARVLIADDDADASQVQASWIGRRLGVYRIERLIGEGGMASVFLAARDEGGFAQQVAIKVLRHGMLDPYEQQRFARERQILARLEHPNIARLIDGGVTSEGVPWFAMERVDGVSITAHCDARQLDVDARLALFLQVCDAVAHAHRALVVHRDLKPSNILVGDDGVLKLLDFGIARLIEPTPAAGEDATVTVAAHRRLTPAYAAPEQWRGDMVTTGADVYALGVLLHELLTGLRPSRRDDDTLRLPSAQLAASEQRDRLAQHRGSTPAMLRRRVAGDLDMILRYALRAQPERRYATVGDFADDIRRHQRQRPVRARPESLIYRGSRYLRRNRVGVIAALLILASIVAGVVATLRQAEQARAAAARAELEATRAGAVTDFLLGLFAGAAPNQAQGRVVTANELLDRGARGLREGMADAPALRAELQLTLAGIYRELGQYEQASSLLDDLAARATVDRTAAGMEAGRLALARGRYEDAEAAVRAALDAMSPDGSAEARARRADALIVLAEILAARDQKDAAETAVNEAIALDRDQPVLDPRALARDQAVLGQIAFGRGDLDGAERAMREALLLRIANLGATHTLVATTQHDLAVILLQRGSVDEAQALFDNALAARRQLLGPAHAEIASTLLNLGALKRRLGDRAAAETNYTEAAAMLGMLFPDGHPELAVAYNSLAILAQEQGRLAAAVDYMDRAIELTRASLGASHPNVGVMLGNLASLLRIEGDLVRAEAVQREGIDLLVDAVGESHHLYGIAINGLGFILLERGDASAAREQFDRAAAVIAAALGESHADYGAVLTGLSEAQLRLADIDSALATARRATDIVDKALPAGHPRRRRTELALADALAATGDCASALRAAADVVGTASSTERSRVDQLQAQCP